MTGWSKVIRSTAVTALVLASAVFAVVLLVDPYDTVWFSPPLERAATDRGPGFDYHPAGRP